MAAASEEELDAASTLAGIQQNGSIIQQEDRTTTLPNTCHCKSCVALGELAVEPLIPCASSKCDRHLHFRCFRLSFLEKFPDLAKHFPGETMVVCTKGCLKQYNKEQKRAAATITVPNNEGDAYQATKFQWDKDGAQGRDDPSTSISVLIAWLQVEGNYRNYRGKNNNGKRKKHFCEEIAKRINEAGVREKRNAKQVQSKIE